MSRRAASSRANSWGQAPGPVGERHGPVAHVQKARLASDRERAPPDDLHPGVLLRVVRGGDGDPAVEAQLADGEVDHLRPDEPEVEDGGAGVGRPVDDSRRHRGRRLAHVAADGDLRRLELLHVRAADRVGAGLVELGAVDPAHVVGLEDLRVEHPGDATPTTPQPPRDANRRRDVRPPPADVRSSSRRRYSKPSTSSPSCSNDSAR